MIGWLCAILTFFSLPSSLCPVVPGPLLARAAAYGAPLDAAGWPRVAVTEQADQANILWEMDNINDEGAAGLFNVTVSRFEPVSAAAIQSWVDEDWLTIIFSEYGSWEMLSTCAPEQQVYDVQVITTAGVTYHVRYAVLPVDGEHFVELFLLLPPDRLALLNALARRIDPDFLACTPE